MTKTPEAKRTAEEVARRIIQDNLGQHNNEEAVKKVARKLYGTIPKETVSA